MRLPVPARDLRPDLRAGHARDAVLHRVPEADRPPLRRRRRRRDRAGEGRGPARLRRPRRADRAATPCRSSRSWPPRARSSGSGASTRRGDLEAHVHRDRRDRRHRRQHPRLRGRRAPRDARQHRRRPAAVQLHPARDRPHRPAGDRDLDRRRLARAGQAHQGARSPTSTASPTRGSRCCSTRSAAGRRARCPTYQDRKAFFEGIVNGEPDPIALLRAGDEAAVRDLIAAAQRAHAPAVA